MDLLEVLQHRNDITNRIQRKSSQDIISIQFIKMAEGVELLDTLGKFIF